MKLTTRHWAAFGAAAVLACVLTGGVIAGHLGSSPPDVETLYAAERNEPMVRVAEIGGTGARAVFAQLTSTGHFCLWDAPSATSLQRQGGCNSADDPLGGRELSVSLAYDGGPAAKDVRDARLIGVASTNVADVEVLMSDGTRRNTELREIAVGGHRLRAFGYRVTRADLRAVVTPVAVLAVDEGGREIDRQATGFGG